MPSEPPEIRATATSKSVILDSSCTGGRGVWLLGTMADVRKAQDWRTGRRNCNPSKFPIVR